MVTRTRLSALLRDKCEREGLTFQDASETMGQPTNSVSRWISLSVLPGPEKYQAIADFLGGTVYEVGGSLALDQMVRYERGLL